MHFITYEIQKKLIISCISLTISHNPCYNSIGDCMYGIDMNQPIEYLFSSLRFFDPNEYHIDRFCRDDVLLLVYEGVLRFREDGVFYEIHPGQYHIQKHNTLQEGVLPSDVPKYLYVHFRAQWAENSLLPKSGSFDCASLKSKMEELNSLSHSNAPYIKKAAVFYEILSTLCRADAANTTAASIRNFIHDHSHQDISIPILCNEFSFSPNYIINIFKKEFGKTPIAYLNETRIKKAEELLISTSRPIESISLECGYRNYSHFYRQFVLKNEISPDRFRMNKRLGK